MALSIDYKLTGSGWAECTIADGEQSCTVTASYLSDAFGDLVLSAVAMLHWFNAVSFSFTEEPGEFRWLLNARPNNELELRILDGDDIFSNPPTPDAECKLLFQTTSSQVEFGRAVLEAGNALLNEHGEEGYLEKWGEYPFPTENFRQLGELVAQFSRLNGLETEAHN